MRSVSENKETTIHHYCRWVATIMPTGRPIYVTYNVVHGLATAIEHTTSTVKAEISGGCQISGAAIHGFNAQSIGYR